VWDEDLKLAVPPGAVPPYRRHDLVHADPVDRPTNAAYDRFVYLAITYRDQGYDDSRLLAGCPFLVEDPLFNSIWCASAHALAEIATLLGRDPGPQRELAGRISAGMREHLWDPRTRRFHALDIRTDRLLRHNTITSLMPLLDPALPPEYVDAIIADLGSEHFRPADPDAFLVPSSDLVGPEFDRRRYWRGPVWINTDWLLWRGLHRHRSAADAAGIAAEIAASMVRLVRRSGWREYFDPFSGAGYGSADFSWSAALVIDLLRTLAAGRAGAA
jgi:glycogen debranching enzyme